MMQYQIYTKHHSIKKQLTDTLSTSLETGKPGTPQRVEAPIPKTIKDKKAIPVQTEAQIQLIEKIEQISVG